MSRKLKNLREVCLPQPLELVPFFLQNEISLESEFHYDLKEHFMKFVYNSAFTLHSTYMHVDEFHKIFDNFPNVVITGITIVGTEFHNTLKIMFDEFKLRPKSLKYVRVLGYGTQTLDVSILGKCVNLEEFVASDYDLDGVEALENCSKLRALELMDCSLSHELNLRVFGKIRRIKWKNTNPMCDVACIANRVRDLEVEAEVKVDEGIKWKKLNSLVITDGRLEQWRNALGNVKKLVLNRPTDWVGFDTELLSNVKDFKVIGCDEIKTIEFENLRKVYVEKCKEFGGFGGIGLWCILRVVEISDCPGLNDVDFLRRCVGLEKVSLTGCENLWIDFTVFEGCKNLENICVEKCKGMDGLECVENCEKLKEFCALTMLGEVNSIIIDANDLCKCVNLENVSLGCTVMNIEMLKKCKLKTINLYWGIQNFDWLGECKDVENICLSGTNVKNLKMLRGCKKLCRVNIWDCREVVSVEGVECEYFCVKRCAKLKTLYGLGTSVKYIYAVDCLHELGFKCDVEYSHLKGITVVCDLIKMVFCELSGIFMCPNLESLMVKKSTIMNVRELKECKKLRMVHFERCPLLYSLSPLDGLKELRHVYAENCGALQDLGGLLENVEVEGEIMGCGIIGHYGWKNMLARNIANIWGINRMSVFFGIFFNLLMIRYNVSNRIVNWFPCALRVGGLNEVQLCFLVGDLYFVWRKGGGKGSIKQRLRHRDPILLLDGIDMMHYMHTLQRIYCGSVPLVSWCGRTIVPGFHAS